MGWEGRGGLSAKEHNAVRGRGGAGRLIRKEALKLTVGKEDGHVGQAGSQDDGQVDALWMDSAGAAGRLVEKLRTEKERERAGKNGAAISCKQNWSGRNKIPLWMPFCPC